MKIKSLLVVSLFLIVSGAPASAPQVSVPRRGTFMLPSLSTPLIAATSVFAAGCCATWYLTSKYTPCVDTNDELKELKLCYDYAQSQVNEYEERELNGLPSTSNPGKTMALIVRASSAKEELNKKISSEKRKYALWRFGATLAAATATYLGCTCFGRRK